MAMSGARGREIARVQERDREPNAEALGLLAELFAGLAPGAGAMDAAGRFPDLTREDRAHYPGLNENWASGDYGTALLQGLSAAGDASAAAIPVLGAGIINPALSAPRAVQRAVGRPDGTLRRRGQTVEDPLREAFPGVYDNPRVIARDAEQMVPPESENLQRLFGTSREELAHTGQTRQGNADWQIPGITDKARGATVAPQVTGSRNTNRLVDTLAESITHAPQLTEGMTGWYVMDPMYQRLEQLVGPEQAAESYRRLQTLTGVASPGSDVLTEIRRGTAANALMTEGRLDDFVRLGGAAERNVDVPGLLGEIPGHAYHKTHAGSMAKYADQGRIVSKAPKVPSYVEAAGVPETGFQTHIPVGDAHWARAVGLPDVRGGEAFADSATRPEMYSLSPWWRDGVAGAVGLESVPAQALAWGAFAPRTGVDTAVGVPKLELWADQIARSAQRRDLDPEWLRDQVLMGRDHAGFVTPEQAGGAALVAGSGLLGFGMASRQGEMRERQMLEEEERNQHMGDEGRR